MLEIDGSEKSGSGTILRLYVALAAINQEPLHIFNIRHNRRQPGLRPQHLESVNTAAKLCNAELEGANDAQVVEDYQDASLSDWYLPTRYDLIKLYQNRAAIGGYSDFAKGWKSVEVSSINEWFRSFVTGSEFRNGKDDEVYVRVIREF